MSKVLDGFRFEIQNSFQVEMFRFEISIARMHPEQIKAHMRMKGTSPSALADAMEKSRMAVSNVIHGRIKSRAIAKRIAKIVGLPIDDLWPGRYVAPQPKKKQPRRSR